MPDDGGDGRQLTGRPLLPRKGPWVTLVGETMPGLKAIANWNAPSSGTPATFTSTVVSAPWATVWLVGLRQTVSPATVPHNPGAAVAVGNGVGVCVRVAVGGIVFVGVAVSVGVDVMVGVGQPSGGQGVAVGVIVAVCVMVGVWVVVGVTAIVGVGAATTVTMASRRVTEISALETVARMTSSRCSDESPSTPGCACSVTCAIMPLPLGPGGVAPNVTHVNDTLAAVCAGWQTTERPVLPRNGLVVTLTGASNASLKRMSNWNAPKLVTLSTATCATNVLPAGTA
jgi:hypothetical protein